MRDEGEPGNLSPGGGRGNRSGRACACVVHQGRVLMIGVRGGRWSLPGGGIEPGESAAQAAVREAWEETGAHVVVEGEPFAVTSPEYGETSLIFLARLEHLEPSPEGREQRWVDPTQVPWCEDFQLAPALAVMRERGWL
ncbi:NUDIX domain-containing protein [Deinococcus sp.]|uniref:NUDIX hydrolase n=1 Tax=Deinococcus sp. TaxID=47478 RepID=UPI0025DAC60F|nr:NUDIX domain-containing protein [Deinococcus sp.]